MKNVSKLLIVAALVACKGKEEEEVLPFITGSFSSGNSELDVTGEFEIYKGFAFNDQGKFWMYLSSNPDTYCGDVISYLSSPEPYEPTTVLSPGKCNMWVKLSKWEGESVAKDDTILVAESNIQCAMGEGDFEYKILEGDNEKDWYWTGNWWQGVPTGYEWTISGDREGDDENPAGYTIDLNMTDFRGSFIHQGPDVYEGSGSVQGSMDLYICDDLASMGL